MPYVIRDAEGRVAGLVETGSDAAEMLPATHPDVLDFLARDQTVPTSRFLASDLALIRVVEDLIEVLVRKHVIALTDLPAPAQEKLLDRRSMRAYLSDVSGVFDEGDGKII